MNISKFILIDKKIIFIIYFIIINVTSIILVSIFHLYQRYVDLNYSILNGVNRAVDNGIKLSDLRGSLRDIADSYLDGEVMISSHLYSNINKVEIIKYNNEKCSLISNKYFFKITINYTVTSYITIDENYKFYFCFINSFYSNTIKGEIKIATWITGFPIKLSSISSYLIHIIILSLLIMFVSIFVLYKILLKQEEYKKRELTIDIIKKLKHEINRPISKIQSISKILFNSLELCSQKSIKDRLNQIFLLTKTHSLVLNSMFSYAIEKNELKNVIEENEINIFEVLEYCLNVSLKENIKNIKLKKNISEFYQNNLIYMDKVFLEISISNILTNAYEAVYRNFVSINSELEIFELEIKFDFDEVLKKMIIEIKNYGSFVDENSYEEIFKPGITCNEKTNTGYGLSILKEIVDSYNGSIYLSSYLDKIDFKKSWVCIKINFNNINYKPICKEIINPNINPKNVITFNKKVDVIRENHLEKFIVVIIDDEIYLLEQWKKLNPSIYFIYFKNYDDFFDSVDQKKINLSNIQLILTDYYFDKIKLGMTLLSNNSLRTLRDIYDYDGYVILVSNVDIQQNINGIDATISKSPISLHGLIVNLKNNKVFQFK